MTDNDEFTSTLRTSRAYPVKLVFQRRPGGVAIAVRSFDDDSTSTRQFGMLLDAPALAAWLGGCADD